MFEERVSIKEPTGESGEGKVGEKRRRKKGEQLPSEPQPSFPAPPTSSSAQTTPKPKLSRPTRKGEPLTMPRARARDSLPALILSSSSFRSALSRPSFLLSSSDRGEGTTGRAGKGAEGGLK